MIIQSINLARMLWNERLSREKIRKLQDDSFLQLFRHAYNNVPFYRELYLEHDISVTDIRSLDDIRKLPTINKQQLRDASASGKLWGNTDRCYEVETSGSSGVPFRFYVGRKDNYWRKAQYLLPYVSTGRKPWHQVLHVTGLAKPSSSWILRHVAFGEVRVRADAPVADQYDALRMTAPRILQGYPSALRLLALYIRSRGLPCPRLRLVYTDSEILIPETRALLQEVFDADVIDVFGTFETDNMAYECAAHDGYHVAEDSVFVETLARDGSVSTDGPAELVCTVLHNKVTPFIRYNLGDLARTVSGPCACGRSSRRLSVIEGRADDIIEFPDRSKRDAQSLVRLTALFFMDLVDEFQIRQIDSSCFDFRLVRDQPLDNEAIARFKEELAEVLPFAEVRVRCVDSIPRTAAGKYKSFVGLKPTTRDAT